MTCEKCKTPNEGICYWWCEKLQDKIHPSLLKAFKDNAEALKRSKQFWPRTVSKIKKLFKRS